MTANRFFSLPLPPDDLAYRLVSVAEMQAIEREADANGLSYDQMMENAGRNLAEVILDEYGFLEPEGALGLVGSGNNGGDTLVALAYLAQQGWKATACLVRARPADDPLLHRLIAQGGAVQVLSAQNPRSELAELLQRHALLLDGILGTGARLPLKPDLAQILAIARELLQEMPDPPVVVAVDCPSGVDCDSGAAAPECLPAEMTVTMAAIKQGLLKLPAFELAGRLRLVDIGLPQGGNALTAWRRVQSMVPTPAWVQRSLPPRPLEAHKGTFGTALIAAGSVSYTGAAYLAAAAAYRCGAGLVTLAVPEPLHTALAGRLPECTWIPLPHERGFIAAQAAPAVEAGLKRATALLIGPGFGLEGTTAEFITELFPLGREVSLPPDFPLVMDADGLKLLTRLEHWPLRLPREAILTPHPGEMSILTGLSTHEIQADRLGIARRYSQEWGHVVVLKGAFTVVAAPSGQSAVIPVATPALARAGTGDVLAGLIVGLRAQGVSAFAAAVAGAWLHATAGLHAAEKLGNTASVLASDVLDAAIEVLSDLLLNE